MPIEIRELVIKAAVANDAAAPAQGPVKDAGLVQAAIEQMSEIKRKEKER